jgi:outer membrane protein OmpA-like peptidoglycan-associated protein
MGMTVEELMALNGMKDTNVYPGQKLIVTPRELSQKSIEEKLANSKPVKPSPAKTGSTTDPKEINRLKMEKAAADAAKKKAIADQLKAKAAAAKAAELAKAGKGAGNTTKTNPSNTAGKGSETAGQGANAQGGKAGAGAGNNQTEIDPMKPRNSADPITGRNPNFNPTPNYPVNNPTINKGVESSNSLAPADKSFYIYCNVTSGVNKNPVGGVLQVVDLKKKDLVYNVQANKTQPVPLFNAGGKQKLLICDIFGYKKQDFDLNLDNIINDSTAQQVQIVDDTIVINFELRRLEKGDVAVAYNIFFYDDASVMLPKSTYELDQLLELMVENKKIKVKIHGHTNTSKLGKILYLEKGDKTFFRLTAKNKETFGPAKMLSKKRAETIKMYLESKRITEDRIETEGHGGSQMLYPNTHPLAFKNKRVEVEILEDK